MQCNECNGMAATQSQQPQFVLDAAMLLVLVLQASTRMVIRSMEICIFGENDGWLFTWKVQFMINWYNFRITLRLYQSSIHHTATSTPSSAPLLLAYSLLLSTNDTHLRFSLLVYSRVFLITTLLLLIEFQQTHTAYPHYSSHTEFSNSSSSTPLHCWHHVSLFRRNFY